jgi:cytochrome c oxidase subunit 3
MWRGGSRLGQIRLSVELCAMYWHYLLLVWLVLFGLLMAT